MCDADWQRRYEAMRASFVERLPAAVLAHRFGYSSAHIRLLRHQFRHRKIDFCEPVPEGQAARRRVSAEMHRTISEYRERRLSAGQITELLMQKGVEISVLSNLNALGIRFIMLRRRGIRLLRQIAKLGPWQRIHIPHAKRKYPNPQVYQSTFTPREYDGELRQLIVRGTGHEETTFMISNDFEAPAELLVGNYARRWRVENSIVSPPCAQPDPPPPPLAAPAEQASGTPRRPPED